MYKPLYYKGLLVVFVVFVVFLYCESTRLNR